MKRILFLLTMLLALSACSQEFVGAKAEKADAPTVFYATIENSTDVDTKVYADEQLRVLWNANDLISVFEKNAYPKEFRFKGQTGDNAGEFEDIEGFVFYTGNEIDNYIAVYPYNANHKVDNDGKVVTLTLPGEQTYQESSFGLGANTMIAVSKSMNLPFKNLCGYLGFKLYGEGVSVSRVMLKGNQAEYTSGRANVTVGLDQDPVVALDSDPDKLERTLVLNCPEPVALGATSADAKIFWLVVPPMTFADGFTFYVEDTNGKQFSKSTHKSITIQRNRLTRMAAIEVIPE